MNSYLKIIFIDVWMDSLVVKMPVSHTGDREFESLSIHFK